MTVKGMIILVLFNLCRTRTLPDSASFTSQIMSKNYFLDFMKKYFSQSFKTFSKSD